MKKNILVICDEEITYCNRISSYLSTHGFQQYTIMTFSSLEKMEEYFQNETDMIKVLLIAESAYQEKEILKIASKIIILQDKGMLLVEDIPMIRKYQAIPSLMREVSELCAQDSNCRGMVTTRKHKTKIYGFYTPGEEDMTHVSACLFAQFLAEKKHVLYLNLSTYANLNGWFCATDDEDGYDLGDLIYYLKQNEEKALYKIEAMKNSVKNLDYITPISYPSDLREIKIDDWLKLLNCICNRSEYEVIVLDCGEYIDDVHSLLEACDEVIMPIRQDKLMKERMKVFTRMYMEKGLEHLLEKIYQVEIAFSLQEIPGLISDLKYGYMGNVVREIVSHYES